ncbi:single-stranded DNA-binding protein [Streptomyces asoensis]|uniref:Single-stranded DNA-binding protein n=1 Tax=Streptomyces asoensis TaxID=249586 RepID=A0ABQ3RYU5_9ACTN|nr:single-stranded DNA-binding protein [Streptomyces asoensis]GGQ48485.1 single-stranded DNA-binding protein 1 [Streptomyces asoensis]GHI61028.1 single-stranded DNA-binding protein 1 [Streptomyces asoensis]
MNETMVCAVGNVATQPVYRDLAAGASARFRLAVTSRYWDREKATWTDGHTNFFTVWANRQLATNAMASLNVGDPVMVQGRLKVRTEQREGQQNWTSADIDAVAIGHDISRGTSAFRRSGRPDPAGAGAGAPTRPEPDWETPAGGATGSGAGTGPEFEPDQVPTPVPVPVSVPVPAPAPVAVPGPAAKPKPKPARRREPVAVT